MARRRRRDVPGAVVYVTNTAAPGRRLFASRADARCFLALLAGCVRARLLNVRAYNLRPARYQLVAESLAGRLSDAMRRVQDRYARWSNLRSGQGGPLFRGRFVAKELATRTHRAGVQEYVENDPLLDQLAAHPEGWLFLSGLCGSAGRSPCWLVLNYGARPLGLSRDLVERWLGQPTSEPEDLDDLLRFPVEAVANWLRRRAVNRDETVVLLREETLERAIGALRPRFHLGFPWPVLEAGLGRMMGGLRYWEVAGRFGISVSTAHARVRTHLEWVEQDRDYATRAAIVVHRGLADEYRRGTAPDVRRFAGTY